MSPTDCNLRCRYCFASTGDFGTGHRMTMDFETAKQAIDWVVKSLASAGTSRWTSSAVSPNGHGYCEKDGGVRPLSGEGA